VSPNEQTLMILRTFYIRVGLFFLHKKLIVQFISNLGSSLAQVQETGLWLMEYQSLKTVI